MPVYIYVLIDPRDENIFYVGQTAEPERRLHQHIIQSTTRRGKKTKTRLFIKEILNSGFEPEMETVEVANVFNCYMREQSWYDLLKSCGFPLTNLTRPYIGGKPGRGIKRNKKAQQGRNAELVDGEYQQMP